MSATRFSLALALLLAPAAVAQNIVYVVVGGVEHPAYVGANTPAPAEEIGPFAVEQAEPFDACAPLQNASAIDGNIAFVVRGTCTFTQKIEHAVGAGAEVVVVMNNDAEDPDAIIVMAVDGVPGKPAVMISHNSGLAILDALPAEATLRPPPCGYPISPISPISSILDTDVVLTAFFVGGFIGDHPDYLGAPGFVFQEDRGLSVASFLVGRVVEGDTIVTGSPYGSSEYGPHPDDGGCYGPISHIPHPYPEPYEDYDVGLTTTFASPLGVLVTASAFARTGDPHVVFDYVFENITGALLDSLFVGFFADFEVGNPSENLGAFDRGANVLYAYDASGTSTNYFGIATPGDVSGWTLATDAEASDASLFRGLSEEDGALAAPQDMRAVLGLGPFALGSDPFREVFVLVAGESERDLLANVAVIWPPLPAVEGGGEVGQLALSVYPNPSRAGFTASFHLPAPAPVTVEAVDVLGRVVRRRDLGVLAAGPHEARLGGADLSAGVYALRVVSAGEVRAVRRVVRVR